MRPGRFVPLMAQRHRCAISPFWTGVYTLTTREPFTPRTPDPDKAPRPPTRHYPAEDKPNKPILVPSKSKAAFQWPPVCLRPFTGRIGNHKWDGDA
jgi:hypothetical protein